MKPLTNIEQFLKRFNHFKDGEFRSLEVVSPTTMLVTFAGQDEARSFDWITITLEFTNVSDAKLIENNKLSLLDMGDGITLMQHNDGFAFSIGRCRSLATIKTSTCHVECQNIKYKEGIF